MSAVGGGGDATGTPPPPPMQAPLASESTLAQAGIDLATVEGESLRLQPPQRASGPREDVGTSRSLGKVGEPQEGPPGSAGEDVGTSRSSGVELGYRGPHPGQSGSAGEDVASCRSTGVDVRLGGTWSCAATSTIAYPVSQASTGAAAPREGSPAPAVHFPADRSMGCEACGAPPGGGRRRAGARGPPARRDAHG